MGCASYSCSFRSSADGLSRTQAAYGPTAACSRCRPKPGLLHRHMRLHTRNRRGPATGSWPAGLDAVAKPQLLPNTVDFHQDTVVLDLDTLDPHLSGRGLQCPGFTFRENQASWRIVPCRQGGQAVARHSGQTPQRQTHPDRGRSVGATRPLPEQPGGIWEKTGPAPRPGCWESRKPSGGSPARLKQIRPLPKGLCSAPGPLRHPRQGTPTEWPPLPTIFSSFASPHEPDRTRATTVTRKASCSWVPSVPDAGAGSISRFRNCQ